MFNYTKKGRNMGNIKNMIKDLPRKVFNKIILDATNKAQQKYGFEIGTGEHATWNNEADAFKHAYMQAILSIDHGKAISASAGYQHEIFGKETVRGERNMDLWNNVIGREIADDIKKVWNKSTRILQT